jgi:hypothetical protein
VNTQQDSLFDRDWNDGVTQTTSGPRRRTPPLDVVLKREVRDALEDALEVRGADGLSWAWDNYRSPYVSASVCLVVSDCRSSAGCTIGMVCNDDVEIDVRNLSNMLALFRERMRFKILKHAA